MIAGFVVALAVQVSIAVPLTAQSERVIPPDSVCSYPTLFIGPCFTIRGRLSASNGYPVYRIWIVGTNRRLGVESAIGCELPPLVDSLVGVEDKLVFADFVVRPLTPERPGEMRRVCVSSAANIRTEPAYFLRPPRSNWRLELPGATTK